MSASNKTAVNKKNGLIELFRFLCAVWVAYFHGFFPVLSEYFDGTIVPVDFFFIVSGFFFLKSIEKYLDRPFWEGVRDIVFGRTKRFIVSLIIAALSIILCNIIFPLELDGGYNWPPSFLWFFLVQFLCLSLYYLLLKKVRKMYIFNIVCVAMICLSFTYSTNFGKPMDIPYRSPGMLAVGMLLSQIPKIKITLKDEKKAEKWRLILNAVGFAIAAAAFIYLAYLPVHKIWKAHVLCLLVCPAVVYFATELPVRSKFLNLLGEFSVCIYLAQCPILFHRYLVSMDTRDQFPLLCICAVGMFILNRIINNRAKKAKVAKQTTQTLQ